jgi:hypothetical protein
MKRVIGVAAASAAILIASAVPVFADGAEPMKSTTLMTAAEKVANDVLGEIPAPQGWHQRHVCAWSHQIDRSWCVYFPWPI